MDINLMVAALILAGMCCWITYEAYSLAKSEWSSAAKIPTPTADLPLAMLSPSRDRMNVQIFRGALKSFLRNCQKTLPLSTLLTVTYKDGSSRVFSFGTQFLPVQPVYLALMTGGSITISQEKSSEEYSPMGVAVSLPSLGLLPEGTRIYPEKTTQTSQRSWWDTPRQGGMLVQSNLSPGQDYSPPSTRN